MRRTVFTLIVGAAAAMYSYTPAAASWITTGREQGLIPEQVPAEATDQPLAPAAALTLIVWVACWLVSRAMGFVGARPIEIAVAVKAVERTIEQHGREIITGRKRRAEIREEIAHADAERDELARECGKNEKERQELAVMVALSDGDVGKAVKELDKRTADRAELQKQHAANIGRGMEIQSRLLALRAAKDELVAEQRELT